jgi:toxin-antitoxin system PIN domain toxin
MTYLPDVNVWIALSSNRHTHHLPAKHWLDRVSEEQIAFCRITELGFLRLLTNRHVMQQEVLTPSDAWKAYDAFRADPRVAFMTEMPGFSQLWRLAAGQIPSGHNAWTDAYLAAFARHADTSIVTFDLGFKAVHGCKVLTLQ